MQDFLRFFDGKARSYPMHLNIYYSITLNWCIDVYRKGCGDNGDDLKILNVQGCDMELCFAEAHVKLKNWLIEHEGGY